MEATAEQASVSNRRSSEAGVLPAHTNTLNVKVNRILSDMDTLGIATQMAGKVVGGVVMLPAYYTMTMHMEGKEVQVPECKLLFSRLVQGNLVLVPATEEELEDCAEQLPREAPVLLQLMSTTAVTSHKWLRVPAVAILGCVALSAEELAQAEALGIPVSTSCTGPYEEALFTQLEVFFKNNKYPDNKCFIMRDHGFAVFAANLDEAAATFDATIRKCINTSTVHAAVAEPPARSAFSGLTSAFKRLGSRVTKDGNPPASSAPSMAAVGELQIEPLGSAAGNLASVFAKGGPLSPTSAAAAAAGSCSGSYTQSGLIRAGVGSPSGSGSLPDDIRHVGKASHVKENSHSLPSFQTGLRPW